MPDLSQPLIPDPTVNAFSVSCVAFIVSRPSRDQRSTAAAPFRAREFKRGARDSIWTVGSKINGPRLLIPRGRMHVVPFNLGRLMQDQRPRFFHVDLILGISRGVYL